MLRNCFYFLFFVWTVWQDGKTLMQSGKIPLQTIQQIVRKYMGMNPIAIGLVASTDAYHPASDASRTAPPKKYAKRQRLHLTPSKCYGNENPSDQRLATVAAGRLYLITYYLISVAIHRDEQ